jgi:type III secretion protein C
MIRNVTHKILKISVVISLIAQTVLIPRVHGIPVPLQKASSEHLFDVSEEEKDLARDNLKGAINSVDKKPYFNNSKSPMSPNDEWSFGWENEEIQDESDRVTFFPEPNQSTSKSSSPLAEKKTEKKDLKYLSDPDQLVPVDAFSNETPKSPIVDNVLSISKSTTIANPPSMQEGYPDFNWDPEPLNAKPVASISTAQMKASKTIENTAENLAEAQQFPTPQTTTANSSPQSLGKKIVAADPYLSLQKESKKGTSGKQTLTSQKQAEKKPESSTALSGVYGPLPENETIAQADPLQTPHKDSIIAQAVPDPALAPSQGRAPPKTILINFNNVSIIEYIRFISRITNKNFIFDENDLQFNVTIISEEPTTIENVMTALIQELRIHGLYMNEQGNSLIIHRNGREKNISRVNTNSADNLTRDSELVTQVFKLNTLDPQRAQRIISPLLSEKAIIGISEDTRHIIITDLVANMKQVETLFQDIDSPNSGLVIGQYVVRNSFIDNLIELAQNIMEPIVQDQTLTFVPHPAANSIFIVASPFIVERTISVLQHLDQFQGSTRIYDLDELKFQQISPRLPAPELAPDRDLPLEFRRDGQVQVPGLPLLPDQPFQIQQGFSTTIQQPPGEVKDGLWELGPQGNWLFRPGFPTKTDGSAMELPRGRWLLDPQNNWYFEPEGTSAPFLKDGAIPGRPGTAPGQRFGRPRTEALLPGEAPRGRWLLDPQGAWIFQLSPGEDLKPERFSRTTQYVEELPVGHIERTKFFIYNLQFRKGEDIVDALSKIGTSLQTSGVANEDLVLVIQSVQWLPGSNSLVFAGTDHAIEKVRELIVEIDRPLRQVFIEMLILETTMDDSLNYGVSWGTRSGGGSTATAQAFLGGASPLSGALSADVIGGEGEIIRPDSSTLATSLGYTLGVIGQRLTHDGTQFATLGALVSALHQRAYTNIVLNPKIITEDNNTAEIFVGINTPYQTQSIANDEGSIITTNFEFRDVGTTLRVTPLIGHSDIITLKIEQEVSRASEGGTAQGGNNITNLSPGPTTSINRTTTTVHVPDKHFVIISGMIQDETIHSRNQFPCLGGIPIIGAAFSNKTTNDAKRNLMIFIRPQIVDTDAELRQLTCDQQEIFKQKNRTKKGWKYEVDEGLDFLNIKPSCCDECD